VTMLVDANRFLSLGRLEEVANYRRGHARPAPPAITAD
jgi:hypothetical protein